MRPITRVLAGVVGLLVWATSASAQSLSATPSPFGQGATITVSAQSPTPPPPGTNPCGDPCVVMSTYAFVYIQGSNGFTGWAESYDGPAQYQGYDAQPGQTMTATDYELYTEAWVEVCLSWSWGQCLYSDYWLWDYGWDVASVTPMAAPTLAGVGPTGGGGPAQTFTLEVNVPSGASHLSSARVWIDATGTSFPGSCLVAYLTDHTLWLLNDAADGWTTGTVGVGPTLQNSQ